MRLFISRAPPFGAGCLPSGSLACAVAGAQYNLATMYINGQHVARDPETAARYFTRAALHADSDSQYALGKLRYEGIGLSKDVGKALEWYRRAALQHHKEAQRQLGKHYAGKPKAAGSAAAAGAGEQSDGAESFKWFLMAATGSNHNGGVDNDGGAGADGGDNASEGDGEGGGGGGGGGDGGDDGDAESQFFVAAAYYEGGNGVPQDAAKAVEWFTKAARQGVVQAQLTLGSLLAEGRVVRRSERLLHLLHRSASRVCVLCPPQQASKQAFAAAPRIEQSLC